MNNQKVPKIRFKGFSGDWEQRKLGDISTSYSGGTPTAGKDEYYGGIIPFIRSGEISSDHTELFLTERGFNSSSAVMVKQGDILYALYGATSGEVSISKLNGAINQAILAVLPNDGYDTDFIMQWLRKSKDSIVSTYLQGGQGNLSATIVNQLHIDLPSYNEQRRIGAFFKVLDNNITLHQSKLDKLKIIKKSMLENCFPKNGENVPKFRFSGFTGDWEQRKLGDLCDQLTIMINPQATPNKHYLEYSMPAYDAQKKPDYVMGSTMNSARKVIDRPCLLINKLNVRKKRIWYIENPGENAVCSAEFIPIYSESVNLTFLAYAVTDNSFTAYLEDCSSGSSNSQKRVMPETIMNANIDVPSPAEQKEIGSFFFKLDRAIALHQSKLDKLKVIKKTLLESMFV